MNNILLLSLTNSSRPRPIAKCLLGQITIDQDPQLSPQPSPSVHGISHPILDVRREPHHRT